MKKIWLYIGGGILISFLIVFWLYSFLYGSPSNTTSIFTEFNFFTNKSASNEVNINEFTSFEEKPLVDVSNANLRQLTTRPVAGARIIQSGTSSIMRYVEAGTGHVYDINMLSGTETRTSQISVPVSRTAQISPSGNFIAISSGDNMTEIVLLNINGTQSSKSVLPYKIEDFTFDYDERFLFTEFENGKTIGKQLDPNNLIVSNLFTIPFTAVNIKWSNSSTTPNYTYTKPASNLMGYGYVIENGKVKRLPQSGNGLVILPNQKSMLLSRSVGSQMISYITKQPFNDLHELPIQIDLERCITSVLEMYYCAFPLSEGGSDHLWSINENGVAIQLIDIKSQSGQNVSVQNLNISSDGSVLYFLNSINKTLWAYTPS